MLAGRVAQPADRRLGRAARFPEPAHGVHAPQPFGQPVRRTQTAPVTGPARVDAATQPGGDRSRVPVHRRFSLAPSRQFGLRPSDGRREASVASRVGAACRRKRLEQDDDYADIDSPSNCYYILFENIFFIFFQLLRLSLSKPVRSVLQYFFHRI